MEDIPVAKEVKDEHTEKVGVVKTYMILTVIAILGIKLSLFQVGVMLFDYIHLVQDNNLDVKFEKRNYTEMIASNGNFVISFGFIWWICVHVYFTFVLYKPDYFKSTCAKFSWISNQVVFMIMIVVEIIVIIMRINDINVKENISSPYKVQLDDITISSIVYLIYVCLVQSMLYILC